MPQEVLSQPRSQPRSPSEPPFLDTTTPLSSRMLFHRARHLEASAFLHHLPFLFWVIDMLRPRSVAQIGRLDPVAYFAACQAMDKLDAEGRCHGIRLAGGEIPARTLRYNTENYREFSQLLRRDAGEASDLFADRTLDLLIVDEPPDEAGIAALGRAWPRRLSARGVVLLHGTETGYRGAAARAFLDGVRASYPTLTLTGGDGLTVVLYGPSRIDRLERLAALGPGMQGHFEMHSVFRRLGETSLFEWRCRDAEDRIDGLRRELDEARHRLGGPAGEMRSPETEALLERERRAHAEAMGKVIGQLTQKLESMQEVALGDRERRQATEHRLAQLESDHEAAIAHAQRMEALSHDLRASTSWRITWPLRRAVTLLRGR